MSDWLTRLLEQRRARYEARTGWAHPSRARQDPALPPAELDALLDMLDNEGATR